MQHAYVQLQNAEIGFTKLSNSTTCMHKPLTKLLLTTVLTVYRPGENPMQSKNPGIGRKKVQPK